MPGSSALLAPDGWWNAAETSADATPFPATVAVRELAYYPQSSTNRYVIAFHKDSATQATLWRNTLSGVSRPNTTSWQDLSSVTLDSGSLDTAMFATQVAFGKLFYCHPGLAQLRYYDGSTDVNVNATARAPIRGRCLAFHKNRLFVGGGRSSDGSVDFPSRLWFSTTDGASGANDWGALDDVTYDYSNFIDVAKDDQEPIEALLPWDGGLLIGKRSGLWYLAGDGPASFQLVQLPGDSVVGPGPQSLVGSPYGVFILGPRGIYLYQGGPPSSVDTNVRPTVATYFATAAWLSGTFIDDELIVSVDSKDLLIYDPELDAFRTEWAPAYDYPVSPRGGIVLSVGSTLMYGPKSATTSFVQSRAQRSYSPSLDFRNTQLVYDAMTPEFSFAQSAATLRHLVVTYRQYGAQAASEPLVFYVYYADRLEGAMQYQRFEFTPQLDAGNYEDRIDIGVMGTRFTLEFWHPCNGTTEYPLDIISAVAYFDQQGAMR
jgi:hypothetical protein